MPVSPSEVFATTGVTGGLSLVCNLMLNEGSCTRWFTLLKTGLICNVTLLLAGAEVFVEEPTYFLAMRIFEDFNLKVTQIPMENDGINLDLLEGRLKTGHVPKAVYTIPTAHNPTGSKRHRIPLEIEILKSFVSLC